MRGSFRLLATQTYGRQELSIVFSFPPGKENSYESEIFLRYNCVRRNLDTVGTISGLSADIWTDQQEADICCTYSAGPSG